MDTSAILRLPWDKYCLYAASRDAEIKGIGDDIEQLKEVMRFHAVNDRFFLMEKLLRATRWVSGASDFKRKYIYDFVRRHELAPWGYMDLAARFHCKSLAITYAGTIQEILRSPEKTQCIFSFKGALAKDFLLQIKNELEINDELKWLFDDILYQNPRKESPKWNENEGLLVKRKGNPKELTLEAVGIVDGKTTGPHYNILRFDDAIEKTCAGSQVFMEKAEEGIRLIIGGLGTHDKVYGGVGTHWKLFDAYKKLDEHGVMKIRRMNATNDNTRSGEPLYLTHEEWEDAKKQFTHYQFSCLMLNDPQADSAKNFKLEWLQFYDQLGDWRSMNRYILVDPATSKKKDSDFTAMVVMGLARDGNYYVLDMVHDRLNMQERIEALFDLVHKWEIKGKGKVGYEKYGMMADIEAIKSRQAENMDFFEVIELGGKTAKEDRIEKLMPICEKGRLWLPKRFVYQNWEGMNVDVMNYFIHWEYLPFPNGSHDDLMDAMARIVDDKLGAHFPQGALKKGEERRFYQPKREEETTSWLSA